MNKRVENNISYLAFSVDDYRSKQYVDVFDVFDNVELSLRYASDPWTKVFSGHITSAKPQLSQAGEVLGVGAWGLGRATVATHCDEAYGVESINNTAVDTPKEIIDDLITNHINKEFGGAASGYTIGNKVENAHAGLSVTHLNSQYFNNFVNINNVCSLTNAYAQGLGAPEVSVHWYVDPAANLYWKKIDADHSDGNWDRYYGGTQAAATIEVKKDMIVYDFNKNVEEYANSIVLSSLLRKPSEDYVTENGIANTLWGNGGGHKSWTDDAVNKVVGANSVKQVTDGAATNLFYPAGKTAGWNLNNIGSPNTIPTINFYISMSAALANIDVFLYTAAGASFDYYNLHTLMGTAGKFYHFSLPVGQYHNYRTDFEWVPSGAADWTNINWFEIFWDGVNDDYINVDDWHFAGVVVREARDVAEIAAHDLHQKVIRNDTATNDSMLATDDSGTAAQLAYAELLRRSQTPNVGAIQLPLLPDLLPGQTLHAHACKQSDSGVCPVCGAPGLFRIPMDMRVKDLRHEIVAGAGFRTVLNLTSDVTNSHAFGVPTRYGLLKEYAGALAHSEARNLKGGTLDNLIPRLTVNY